MTQPTFLWRIETKVPRAARAAIEDVLETRCVAVASFKVDNDDDDSDWLIEGFTGAEPDRDGIRKDIARTFGDVGVDAEAWVKCDLVPPRDWLAENMTAFLPVSIGRYFIHGTHFDGLIPAGAIPILLDPGTAFGSGEHASTAGCLEALDSLARSHRFRRPLDMGCGSGILGIAVAKTWRAAIIASDIDPESARVTRLNARRNGVGALIRAVCGPGYQSRPVNGGGPYDLITANILARPLIHMACDLSRHLRSARDGGGIAVLSGLLERDGNRVAHAHQVHGLRIRRRLVRNGWLTLVMSR